jgi:hypothetical protein
MATLVPGEMARMYALGGLMRGGASRGGYIDGRVYVSIGGSDVGWVKDDPKVGTLINSLSITQQLDEVPDTATLRINAAVPPAGGEVVIALGSQNGRRLFAGYGLTRNQLYAADKPANIQADFSAVDYTWLLAFAKVTKQYRNVSGTAIIADLIATYGAANGFTTNAVQANLPALEITFTDEDVPNAITRLMRRLGGHWFVDYAKDIHAWIGEDATMAPPMALTPTHPSLADVRATVDQTQALTRCYVEGRGSRIVADVLPGESMIPLESADMFPVAPDVFGKVSFAGSDGGAQHIGYTGVSAGGAGSLVGPGIGPSAAVSLAAVAGAGVNTGAHDYVTTFVTATGESLPGPRATVTTGAVADPTDPPSNVFNSPYHQFNGSTIPIGDSVTFLYAYSTTAMGQPVTTDVTAATAGSTPITTVSNQDPYNPTNSAPVVFTIRHSADPRVRRILIYSYAASRPGWGFLLQIENLPQFSAGNQVNTAGSGYSNLTIPPPGSNSTAQNQIAVSNIPIGSATVTGRKLYRTAANQTPLKLLTTIANNTATTYTDAAADATLGATAPASDTSGLQQPAGKVPAGATALPVAGASAFLPTGGWAVIGNGEQVIRYTGITGGSLTGIPASGSGAITAAVAYNSTVTAPGMLTGIPATGARAIVQRITAGDEVYLVVQVDDTGAQSLLASRLGVATGIREEWVADRRLSYTEAKARGQATLAVRPLDALSLSYRCRDLGTSVGKTITVNLPAPTNIVGTFRIQAVTITNFRPYAWQPPTFLVQASSTRFTFEDWLRIMKTDT